ncbi:hypothetical protein C8R48DRAFT_778561 [Suillus tomentosus]|nr:hypothetical protein C8R48DRAFT_778561 [Suillus tomentosus]
MDQQESTYGHHNTPENMLPMYDQSMGQIWDLPMMPEWPSFILQPQRLEQADLFSIENDHNTHQFAVNSTNQQHMAHEDLPLGLAPFPPPLSEFYNQHNLISSPFTQTQQENTHLSHGASRAPTTPAAKENSIVPPLMTAGRKRAPRSCTKNETPSRPSRGPTTGNASEQGTDHDPPILQIGVQRGEGGNSDTEIAKLGETDANESSLKVPEKKPEKAEPRGLTEEEKLLTIQYITDEKHWTEFRVRAGYYWTHISQVILEGRVSAEQVRNYWHNQALEKYKACHIRQEHTGGGDGDADKQDLGFSDEVLDAFEASEIYQLIDSRARNDESIVRHQDYNSSPPVNDDESGGPAKKHLKRTESDENTETSRLLQQAVIGIAERNQKQAKAEDERLELARKKDL